ncbi:28S ribosomal protein S31, mitochondrial [Nematolebias whitei]|uniref:28S ribosomal protein S31, mitochondrial n=1 Tax=Nematolebias whitei TaxID=451745 RepID=UPI00189B8C82|nr:28S ribosomal protein S31, mitochondrial [Nematolebias whitei]
MYRLLSRTACVARKHSVCVHEPCQTKCKKASRTFNGVGVNTLSTSSFRLCEKKDPPGQGETTNAERESSQTQKAEQQVEPAVLKEDDGQTSSQEAGVEVERVWSKPGQVNAAKSGKENLLDLLKAMKVEVTNKKMLKKLTLSQHFESAVQNQSKPKEMASTNSMFQKATMKPSQSETLDPYLTAASSAAASTLPNSHQAESELLQLLKQMRQRKDLPDALKNGHASNIKELIANMKVGKKTFPQNAWSTDQIKYDDDRQGYLQAEGVTSELANDLNSTNIFPVIRLNVFSTSTNENEAEPAVAKQTLWDVDFANKLFLATNQSPRNRLEEMIQWTKEGRLWQYPINNEIGLEEEASVPFHEHVLLEKHLEEGFPQRGPVRHFMELVLAGLSKNPYLTVQQKKEHIAWFRDYFHQKEDVLNNTDVYLS